MYRILSCCAVCVLVSAPALAQEKSDIQKLNDDFVEAFDGGDFDKIASMYTEDAYLLPAGAPMVHGRDDIKAFWSGAAGGMTDFALSAEDVKSLGDGAAREIGTFSLTMRGDQPQHVTGKYVVIWEKGGDGWQLATDIWNTNQ